MFSTCYVTDVVALSETKTNLPVLLSGYVSYRGRSFGSDDRGGVVLVKKKKIT